MNDDKYTKYSRGLSELHERALLVSKYWYVRCAYGRVVWIFLVNNRQAASFANKIDAIDANKIFHKFVLFLLFKR